MSATLEHLLVIRTDCRICGKALEDVLAAYERLPVAGTYVDLDDAGPHPLLPLTLVRCSSCGLVQLRESLAPSFYSRYSFMSGVATGYKNYLALFAQHIGERLPKTSRILEIGCSDGTLMQLLETEGFSVTGFEPATRPAQLAAEKGLKVVNDFFNVATSSSSGFERVDTVIVRHVMEHLDDFPALFEGLDAITTPSASLLIEVPDLASTLGASLYSNIYHIHPCYFDVDTLSKLLRRNGWLPQGATIVDIFGGSLLLWATRDDAREHLRSPFSFEGLSRSGPRAVTGHDIERFLGGWRSAAAATRNFFEELKASGKRVAGYGAAERTTSLMGVAGLDRTHIEVVFDKNANLVGKLLPGSGVPIRCPNDLPEFAPEYLAIFAQSFEREIMIEQTSFHQHGGKFISLRSGVPVILP